MGIGPLSSENSEKRSKTKQHFASHSTQKATGKIQQIMAPIPDLPVPQRTHGLRGEKESSAKFPRVSHSTDRDCKESYAGSKGSPEALDVEERPPWPPPTLGKSWRIQCRNGQVGPAALRSQMSNLTRNVTATKYKNSFWWKLLLQEPSF